MRGLMALIMLVGLGMGLYVRSVQVQQRAVAAVQRAGGTVTYNWEWNHYNPDIININGRPRAPKWLADRIGVDYVGNVVAVNLMPQRAKSQNKANDETLAQVSRLGHLESLELNGTAITDAGLGHIKTLTKLRHLGLGQTLTSDAGLPYLNGMSQLVTLNLAGSRVTDDGVLELERALPRVQIIREDSLQVYPNLQRATKDLDFAQSQPVRVACKLLTHRAKVMASHGDWPELIATVNALCNLKADDKLSLLRVAEARAECLGTLEPYHSPKLPASDRQALQSLCTNRAIDALTLAIEKGYNNILRLKGGDFVNHSLGNLRNHPAYPRLIETMKRKRSSR
ncbi:hypothetical protein Sinac_2786 [Singulisphaera acidiphila DSM 18658]|uniref:F-box/LRR-repeat protein 15-like leucin rich repeat domain-containing protein n=2 Tax=Singulisphaera acidiphila TaxID=466153 RepID=L0DCH4_SINAD|nr:hypothetical protein Sinac_2786 [Singulisphaera acidiphila DSM 18658]